jgi:hypothetical protein
MYPLWLVSAPNRPGQSGLISLPRWKCGHSRVRCRRPRQGRAGLKHGWPGDATEELPSPTRTGDCMRSSARGRRRVCAFARLRVCAFDRLSHGRCRGSKQKPDPGRRPLRRGDPAFRTRAANRDGRRASITGATPPGFPTMLKVVRNTIISRNTCADRWGLHRSALRNGSAFVTGSAGTQPPQTELTN